MNKKTMILKKIALFLVFPSILTACAHAPNRNPSQPRAESGPDPSSGQAVLTAQPQNAKSDGNPVDLSVFQGLYGTLREDRAAILSGSDGTLSLTLVTPDETYYFSGQATATDTRLQIGETEFEYRQFEGDLLLSYRDTAYLLEPLEASSDEYLALRILTEPTQADGLSLSFQGMNAHLTVGNRQITVAATFKDGTIVLDTGSPNLALGATATASSVDSADHGPAFAVDGNSSSRWSSSYAENQWLEIDLGQTQSLTKLTLRWEKAAGKDYRLMLSEDGTNWITVADVKGNSSYDTTLSYTFDKTSARYIRMEGITKTTEYGFSIWELAAYEGDETDTEITFRRTDGGYSLTLYGVTYLVQNEGVNR
ncbi:MAG: discoidin domain-containing protein [Eubacteriales bacterium]